MSPTLTDWQTAINHALDEQLATVANPHLRAAMAYSVDAGGKRLRPLLLLSIVAMYDGVVAEALPAATALEFVHTYSLIHDDLPAMDMMIFAAVSPRITSNLAKRSRFWLGMRC